MTTLLEENRPTRYIPTYGILIFIGLYLIAASLYPGGSQVDPDSHGFDWVNNYWCNLFYSYALNGELNPARPYAIMGMVVLCISLGFFFYEFPKFFKTAAPWNTLIPVTGIMGMIFALFVYSDFHDLMVVLSCLLGTLSIIGIFFGLRNHGLRHFIWTGFICVALIGLNGYLYFSQNYLTSLPLIQKITFVVVLLWIVLLNSLFTVKRGFFKRRTND
jgi:hypothetical protein